MAQTVNTADSDVILSLGDGVGVRQLRDSDMRSIARHGNSANVRKALRDSFPSPYDEKAFEVWMNFVQKEENMTRAGKWTPDTGAQGPLTAAHYAITINDEACGGIGIALGAGNYVRSGELGYWLSDEHWGKGVMSRVVPAFVQWIWETFDVLIRLNGAVFEYNQASAKVLEKAGFRFEGRRENAVIKDGKVGAELMYGALRPAKGD